MGVQWWSASQATVGGPKRRMSRCASAAAAAAAAAAACVLVGAAGVEAKTTCNLQCDCEGVNGTTVAEAGGLQVIIGDVVLAETVQVCDETYECPGCQACRQRCDCTAPVPFCAGTCLKFPGFVCNDPHVRGFDGTAFDLQGEDGASYAIVSAPGIALNARVWRPDVDASFVDAVGLVWIDPSSGAEHTLAVGIDADDGSVGGVTAGEGAHAAPPPGVTFEPLESAPSMEHTSVVLDGVRLGEASGVYRAFDGLLEIEANGGAETPTVRISLPNLEAIVMHSKLQSATKQHFDLSVTHFRNPCEGDAATAHGLLGQTLAEGESEFVAGGGRRRALLEDQPTRTALGLADLDGEWEDEYQTDGLLGTSFAFSRFLSTCDLGTVSV